MPRAIYPGTFDPLTRGHEDLVRRASRLFGSVVLAVADSRGKHPLFEVDERIAMAREALKDVENVEVVRFSGLLVDFVRAHHGDVVVRGLRAVTDFDYEFQMAGMNRQLMPELETIFMTPTDEYQFVSATLVREIAKMGGDVEKFVPPVVMNWLQKRVIDRDGAVEPPPTKAARSPRALDRGRSPGSTKTGKASAATLTGESSRASSKSKPVTAGKSTRASVADKSPAASGTGKAPKAERPSNSQNPGRSIRPRNTGKPAKAVQE